MRSMLFVPAHRGELIEKSQKAGADVLIYDIEDSCPWDKNKKFGKKNIGLFAKLPSFVRINNYSDIEDVHNSVSGIVYPKAETAYIFETIQDKYPGITVYALIESAEGVLNCQEIAKRVDGLIFGNEDYRADTLCNHFDFARNMILNAAKSAKIEVIDTVHVDVHNLDDLRNECALGKSYGFDGKLCLSPKELPIVHEYFTPTENEFNYSKRVLELYEEAKGKDEGVAIIDGVYVAPPMVKYAEKVIKKYLSYV